MGSLMLRDTAPCLLSDTPASWFQDTLKHLEAADVAGLRHVSTHISNRATQHAPYVILRLSADSTREQIRQWCQVTWRLQLVNNIHIHVAGKITAEVFDLAIKLASLRSRVTDLHISGHKGGSSSSSNGGGGSVTAAYVPSIYPLHFLLPQLRSLSITDVAVGDLSADLAQLAAAQGSGSSSSSSHRNQLQSLMLHASWTSSGAAQVSSFAALTVQLPQLFPQLRKLTLQVPPLLPELPAAAAAAAGSAAVAALPASEAVAAAAAQQQFAAVAALAVAVTQLQQLEILRISGLPDIWNPSKRPAAAAVVGQASTADAAAATGAASRVLIHSKGPAAAAAPAAIKTFDSLGCWILQQQQQLREVHLSTAGSNWAMSWQQQQQQQQHVASIAKSSCTTAAALVTNIKATYHAGLPRGRPATLEPSSGFDNKGSSSSCRGSSGAGHSSSSSSSSSSALLLDAFKQQLSHYSSRPAADLLCHVSSCQLAIHPSQTAELSQLLSHMTGLKHFKLTILSTSRQVSTATSTTAAALVAAAAVKDLQSLTLLPGMSHVYVTPDLLLPLTAAAGGPGSSLRKIRLVGYFSNSRQIARACAAESAAAPAAAPAAASASGWYVIRQLGALQDLCIHHMGTQLVDLLADCLPASVERFEGRRLNIIAAGGLGQTTGGSSSSNGSSSMICQHAGTSPAPAAMRQTSPALSSLHLQLCHLSDPSILASRQLTQLTAAGSSWPGGWPAAAAAWPAIRKLVVWQDYSSSNRQQQWRTDRTGKVRTAKDSNSSSSSSRQRAASRSQIAISAQITASDELMHDLVQGFSHLRHLTVQNLPGLTTNALQQLATKRPHLRILNTSPAAAAAAG